MAVCEIIYSKDIKTVSLYFDGGCNFSCLGCIARKRVRSIKRNSLTAKEVNSILKTIKFEKVIHMGLEPTMDDTFIPLIKILKKDFGVKNILITNGWKYVDEEFLDEVCVSIKAITKDIFKWFTGVDDPKPVLKNFWRYSFANISLRAESIYIPNRLDKTEIEKIARFISDVNPEIPYRIDGYFPSTETKLKMPSLEDLIDAKKIAENYLSNVSILHPGMKLKYSAEKIY